jgi:hypothetical protein
MLFPECAGIRLPSKTNSGSPMPPMGRQKPFRGQWNPVRALIVPRVGFETHPVVLIFFTVFSFERARGVRELFSNSLLIRY